MSDSKSAQDEMNKNLKKREDDNTLPLACSICKQPFFELVFTNCHHYFCEKCALKHQAENHNCFLCNKPTQGALEIKKQISQEREEAKAMVKNMSKMVEVTSKSLVNAKVIARNALENAEAFDKISAAAAAASKEAWQTAAKAVEMVQAAEATMEAAKVDRAKAFAFMKTVWNV